MNRHHITLAATVVAALFLLTVCASHASADTVTYDFTSCHINVNGGTGNGCGTTSPYGDVVLTDNNTGGVDVVVNLFNGTKFVQTGAGDDYALKFVGLNGTATTITNSDISVTSTAPTNGHWQVDGPSSTGLDGDGTGVFAFGICVTDLTGKSCGDSHNTFNGGSDAYAGPLMFTVANATIAQVAVANTTGHNASGQVFVADVLFTNGNTGPIDASTPSVPDGGVTLMLLGGALVGLETLRRRLSI